MKNPDQIKQTQTAIIIGAGPAGLTAAYELLTRTNIKPIILEKTAHTGGLSRTVVYKGNRMDIGGHRFFSKSERVMQWWLMQMPLMEGVPENLVLQYRNQSTQFNRNSSDKESPRYGDMMVRPRKSRIYFLKKFFPYPLTLSVTTLYKLGLWRTTRIFFSYIRVKIFPLKEVVTLEDFFISRFGSTLYRTFFKSYTEKVWGVPCHKLPASWGVQRIKNLSIREALKHMLKFSHGKKSDLAQQEVNTSLIEQFLYPRLGPGQLWETVAQEIIRLGGEIHYEQQVQHIACNGNRVEAVTTRRIDGLESTFEGAYFFSTMPLNEVVAGIKGIPVPAEIADIAAGLQFRDFITIGLLVKSFSDAALKQGPLTDNWIYIQDESVKLGRLQIFNNWSPWMVADPENHWIGLEYFCNTGDSIWNQTDDMLIEMAIQELVQIGLIDKEAVMDGTVIRQEKTYPSYTGSYASFHLLKNWISGLENFFPVGRNGMHRYNNSDHSMLTAMVAVDYLSGVIQDRNAIWEVNTEEAYHEEKQAG